jgi:DNA-binding transcriptional ArsR family regulator
MSSEALGKPDVLKREVAIVTFLRTQRDGATAGEIYDVVSEVIGDTISRPAYYKLLDRLEAAGKIERREEPGVRRYVIPPQLFAANRLTLDDVYELLPFVESSESMARAIEAQQFFMENRDTVIRAAALALVEENAVELFWAWIDDLIKMLRADLDSYNEAELADSSLERRIQAECNELRDILYRQLSVPSDAVNLPDWEGPSGLKRTLSFEYDPERLREMLETRVFGVGKARTTLGLVTVDKPVRDSAAQEMIISGSDGSFHAGTVGIRTAHGYIEDESFIVTFNNSVVYVRSSERVRQQKGEKKFVHSAPLTRQTIDDPAYKGMVLAPFMFPMLTESEYEHMVRTATDVVQLRVDEAIFNGTARDVATGEKIMTPRVHIRDGTITPQSRGFNHYYRMDPYGDITRDGINLLRNILQRIQTARGAPQVYAGAVKSTQIRLFSRLINWYIRKGSRRGRRKAIAADWDPSHALFLTDIDVMTTLLASLEPRKERDGFWMSCVVLRQFSSLAEFYDIRLDGRQWFDVLRDSRERALAAYELYRGELPYHAIISEDDLEQDSYLYLLENADFASFYIGHTAGDPAPKVPRYEFLCSLHNEDANKAQSYIERVMDQLVTALLTCEFTADRDHNFLSRLSLVKLIPSVVYQAHEYAKHVGKKLENEYKSVVVARLAARRNQKLAESDAEIQPISIRRYLQRFSNARRALPPSEQEGDAR